MCPGDQELPFHFESTELDRRIRYYWTTACKSCPLKAQCTREPNRRRIKRWVDEHILEAMQERVAAHPEKLQQRKEIVEHPFGTLKHWWDHSHFLLRGLAKVRGEFSLSALTYNLRRVLNIVGVRKLLKALHNRPGKTPTPPPKSGINRNEQRSWWCLQDLITPDYKGVLAATVHSPLFHTVSRCSGRPSAPLVPHSAFGGR